MSSSAPQLLLAPESRKDKVSKNDLRYLFRLNKSNQRSRKRAAVDKQIKSEKQDAEKRRRLSNAVGEIKKLRKAASKFRGQGTSKSKKSIDQQTYEESIAVYEGEKLVPCFFEPKQTTPLSSGDNTPNNLKEDFEILNFDPHAVIWRSYDYPNIIPHKHLWLVCNVCQCGVRCFTTYSFKTFNVFERYLLWKLKSLNKQITSSPFVKKYKN